MPLIKFYAVSQCHNPARHQKKRRTSKLLCGTQLFPHMSRSTPKRTDHSPHYVVLRVVSRLLVEARQRLRRDRTVDLFGHVEIKVRDKPRLQRMRQLQSNAVNKSAHIGVACDPSAVLVRTYKIYELCCMHSMNAARTL
jgi:hypothetical protein